MELIFLLLAFAGGVAVGRLYPMFVDKFVTKAKDAVDGK